MSAVGSPQPGAASRQLGTAATHQGLTAGPQPVHSHISQLEVVCLGDEKVQSAELILGPGAEGSADLRVHLQTLDKRLLPSVLLLILPGDTRLSP